MIYRISSPSRASYSAFSVGIVVLLLGMGLSACDDSPPAIEDAVFVVRACGDSTESSEGETFRVLLRDPDVIAEAERLLTSGDRRIISGQLKRSNGGFNEPWSWHMDPSSVEFADLTIELCDGCPSFVEDDLDYWIDTVGTYCPWSTEIIARER